MPFVKGQTRPPGAGRKRKTVDVAVTVPIKAKNESGQIIETRAVITVPVVMPNPKLALSADLWGQLQELGCNPFAILALLAMDETVENGVRRLAASDLAGFLLPKKKSIEHSGVVGQVNFSADALRQALLDRLSGVRTRFARAAELRGESDGSGTPSPDV